MGATEILYSAAHCPVMPGDVSGLCRACGRQGVGLPFDRWVKDTFNDFDRLAPGEIVCHACLFSFDDRREDLAALVGKDKPQRMRNYSHFVVDGKWTPCSKGDKRTMTELLLGNPALAVVAVGGQKHIIFKARAGWWQIEEQSVLPFPAELRETLAVVEALYNGGFSKGEIETGRYIQKRIMDFGFARWHSLEQIVRPWRGAIRLELALFLAQKDEEIDDGGEVSTGGTTADSYLAGGGQRLQEPLRPDNLAAIRGQHPQRGLHQQPEPILQRSLFEAGGHDLDP